MPRTQEHADRYRDALTALAAATQRPANVVNTGAGYAIRVDFEYNRYLLASNAADGLTDTVEDTSEWRVSLYQGVTDGTSDELLAAAEHAWLVDAFDLAFADIRAKGKWQSADASFDEFTPTNDQSAS
ncbi:hypothetical protein JOJ86_001909 [Rhodococcus percolatus]|uniref:Uncharacterized protein n=2 Tax=Rhodococcus opacus TaxID=37919 RepID=A0A1B1JZH5_RHOOP|nr:MULTISPECIES: hypothetical protein [Rhodococcus]ANS25751.1 hypothetical protein R1CP_05075 [Rhodococcus opacus]EID73269.1 hypothetical protein W59_34258 [Rhodococcus opacus RKJ300 = JCM 13270]MBA8958618.1 hypothetical protein [Rhodococcus opacus]MBP2204183.1 hypothetical protein [Rhodococcus opacus]QDQ90476.1 hypothetical protein FND50_06490 [Rhodococcus sp. WB9]